MSGSTPQHDREEDRLPMSSFLHTIPEGSSDIGATTSQFNPTAAANSPSSSTGGDNSAWAAMMKPFRPTSQGASNAPRPPASVASSTRAVEAGAAGVSSIFGSGEGGMDGSTTAAAGLGEGSERVESFDAVVLPTKRKRTSSFTQASKQKVGMVCLFGCAVVLIVIVVLVLIVQTLDRDDGSEDQPGISIASTAVNDTLDNNSTEDLFTVAPTPYESIYATTQAPTATPLDDDFVDDGYACEEESLLVQLDNAIYMLYTAEEAELNMLPHVSSEVFSNTASPRYLAREWLLNNDTLLQSALMESAAADCSQPLEVLARIAQRYIMLVFYFSTLDPETAEKSGGNARQLATPADRSKFTIHPDVHECYWIHNACGQEDTTTTSVETAALSTVQVASASQLNAEMILYLNASHACLKGTLPFELGYLSGLFELTLHGNELEGTIPALMLSELQFLYALDLSQNKLEGNIPSALWTLPILRFAYLHGNKLSGTIPQTLTDAPSADLEEIWLQNNRLSGSLPEWWTELPNLDVLSVSNNSWTGKLPEVWAGAESLVFFDVSLNQMTGPIPAQLLYSVPSLRFLYLDYNQLSGPLPMISSEDPTSVSSRMNYRLEALWLQYNQLSETIPKGFASEFSRLRQLELQGNQLTGQWECMEGGADVWPQLEELAVDCLANEKAVTESNATSVSSNSNGGGVDMSLCSACCIVCF